MKGGVEMKKINKKDVAFRIFSSVCIFLSVYVFSSLRQFTGDPAKKMVTDVLIILLLTVLNTVVLVLYEIIKKQDSK